MFSIRKRHKIQVLCNIDQYSSHPTGVPQDFHKATSSAIILKYAKAAQRAIQATGSVNGVSKVVGYNPNDWYGVPKIEDITGLKKWMKGVGINIGEFTDPALLKTIGRSIELAQSYIARKNYYLPKALQKNFTDPKKMISTLGQMSKYTSEADIRASTTFLKVIRACFKNITTKDSTGELMFNPLTGELRDKDRNIAVSIMKFFNSDAFSYNRGDARLGQDSIIAHGRTAAHGTDTKFNAVIDFKTLESQVLKTISQNEYDAAESVQDKNRMQIEVKTKKDMLHMALVLIQSGFLKKGIRWEQKGNLFPQEDLEKGIKYTEEWINFQESYIRNNTNVNKLFSTIPIEKIKGNTIQREELKITSTDTSFEIQIVLEGNSNESGWNANPYYKMKGDIDEEITLRGGYITKERVIKHILRRLPDLEKFGQSPKEKDPEKIFEHFVSIEKKIIPLFDKNYKAKNGSIPSYKHVKFFTNKSFTSRGVRTYSHELPFKIWHESTGTFNPINTLSSPSTL